MLVPMDILVYRDGLTTPWGFRLQGGVDYHSPLVVQKVVPYSSVDGFLRQGDVIAKIDEYDTTAVTHNFAMNLIASAGSSIKFTVLRSGDNLKKAGGKKQVVSFQQEATRFDKTHPTHVTSSEPDVQHGIPSSEEILPSAKLARLLKESFVQRNSSMPESKKEIFQPVIQPWPHPARGEICSFLPQIPPRRSQSQDSRVIHQSQPSKNSLLNLVIGPAQFGVSSGASSPSTSSVIELGSPEDPHRPVGVWTPPLHQPHTKLVHLQYNSPLSMYSAYNVADTVEKMTGSKLQWVKNPPSTKFIDDIRESPTYKFVQEIESGAIGPSKKIFEQSKTMKQMNRYFGLDQDF